MFIRKMNNSKTAMGIAIAVAFSYDPLCAAGAFYMCCVLCAVAFFQDAYDIGTRPSIVTPSNSLPPNILPADQVKAASTNYSMVPQSSLGIFNGILIKLLYEYRLFGTRNCVIRFIQRTVTGSFEKKKLPCAPTDILAFATKNRIPLDGWDRKLHEYKSIDDFFTRSYATLDWGMSRPRAVVSPSEGTAVAYESVALMQELWVKQKRLSLQTMGIPKRFLSSLQDCTVVYLKLDVHNLHRFYAPVSGTIVSRVDHLEPLRMSHSVRPFCLHAGWNILTENRRVILMIDNPEVGVVAMMVVGGIAIDGIDIVVQEGQRIEQGDEIGCFHMGGSAILLAVPRGRNKLRLKDDLAVSSLLQNEFSVRVGDTLALCQ